MKKVFFLLLAINVLFAIVASFKSEQQTTFLDGIHPEQIVLLSNTMSCVAWGDFAESEVNQVEDALNLMDLPRFYKKIPAKTLVRYWVHTDPFENRQTVEREINKLRNMGVISYRVQEEGKWLNAISFGEFGNAVTAQKLRKTLIEKNEINALIHEYKIEQYKYLIFDLDLQMMNQYQQTIEEFPNSSLEQTTCERL